MTGIFPNNGVPATQTTQADPNVDASCTPLFHATNRCNPRFDPASANALISEIANLINCGGQEYDCSRLDNLCAAVNDLIQQGIVGCLTKDFANGDDACTIRNVTMITDADGCKRFAIVSDAERILASVLNNSVVGNAYPAEVRPQAPTNPATYYNLAQLKAAADANAIDYSRLNNCELYRADVTITCPTTVEVYLGNSVTFEPSADGGAGRESAIVISVDGVFVRDSANNIATLQRFTNFQNGVEGRLRLGLGTGVHNIRAYVVAVSAVRYAATVGFQGSPVASGGQMTVSRDVV